jgi:hypothetical protein
MEQSLRLEPFSIELGSHEFGIGHEFSTDVDGTGHSVKLLLAQPRVVTRVVVPVGIQEIGRITAALIQYAFSMLEVEYCQPARTGAKKPLQSLEEFRQRVPGRARIIDQGYEQLELLFYRHARSKSPMHLVDIGAFGFGIGLSTNINQNTPIWG